MTQEQKHTALPKLPKVGQYRAVILKDNDGNGCYNVFATSSYPYFRKLEKAAQYGKELATLRNTNAYSECRFVWAVEQYFKNEGWVQC